MLPYRGNRLTIIIILVFFLGIAAYAYFEAQGVLYGPKIAVAMPVGTPLSVDTPAVRIRGTAKNITELTMDGNPVSVTEAGAFDEPLLLSSGYNKVVLVASDKFGRQTQQVLEIVYTGTSTMPTASTSTNQ